MFKVELFSTFKKSMVMRRLIQAIVVIAVTSFGSATYAYTKTEARSFPYITEAAQFPQTKAKLVRHSFKIEVPKGSSALLQLTINIPDGLVVRNDFNISDQFEKKVDANIIANDKNITIAFSQPIAPGTELNVDFNRVSIVGSSNGWLYPVSVKLVGLNADIPVGNVRLRVFD